MYSPWKYVITDVIKLVFQKMVFQNAKKKVQVKWDIGCELSEYEKIREQNIKDIQRTMAVTISEISNMKQDITSYINDDKKSKKKYQNGKVKLNPLSDRILRPRKPVNYRELLEPEPPVKGFDGNDLSTVYSISIVMSTFCCYLIPNHDFRKFLSV